MKCFNIRLDEMTQRLQTTKRLLARISSGEVSASLSGIEYYQPEVSYLRALQTELNNYPESLKDYYEEEEMF